MGDGKREQPERDAAIPGPHEAVEIDFQPGDEHDIKQSDRTEHGDGGAALDQIQPVRPQQCAAGEQQDQVRNPQPACNQRSDENQKHQKGENQNRVLNRKHEQSFVRVVCGNRAVNLI
ncbi:hypothetical protein SDC9_186255 [bioreactor metagenome]|uniref:Uncharacterized protein n=1 Tax=bioreactor metagenome TaxID=1076179 RepID=A0A645HJ10_9ZZZZ